MIWVSCSWEHVVHLQWAVPCLGKVTDWPSKREKCWILVFRNFFHEDIPWTAIHFCMALRYSCLGRTLVFVSGHIWQIVFELDSIEIVRTDSSLLIVDIEVNTIRASLSHMYPIRGGLSYSENWKYIVCMVVVSKWWEFISVCFGKPLSSTLSPFFSAAAHCHTFLIQNTKWSKKCRTQWADLSTREIALQEILNC